MNKFLNPPQPRAPSVEEVKEILRKEEERRRSLARRRNEEIKILLTEQNLDLEGKLWGEIFFSEIASKKNNGQGVKWQTDAEAELVPDIVFGLDPDTVPQPVFFLELLEALEIAGKVIREKFGQEGLSLFGAWLQMTCAELCREKKLPAKSTMEQIKSMVLACREEAGSILIFPFPEEEKEIKELALSIRRYSATRRHLEGTARPADPENRVYLTPEERKMSVDNLFEYLLKKGFKLSRATAHRAKKTGFFMKPGWKRLDSQGEKVVLTEEEKSLSITSLSKLFGITRITARKARKVGYFFVTKENCDKVTLANRDKASQLAKAVDLPDKIYEIAGRKIQDLSRKEIKENLGLGDYAAQNIKRRGYLRTTFLQEAKRQDLFKRLAKIKKSGWISHPSPKRGRPKKNSRGADGINIGQRRKN